MSGSPQPHPLIQHVSSANRRQTLTEFSDYLGPSLHFFIRPSSHLLPEDLEHELEVIPQIAVSFWN